MNYIYKKETTDMKKNKQKNFIIVRIMENDKCIHAHEITNLYGELAKYTKSSYPNEAGGYTTIVEIPVNPFQL